MTTRPLTLQNIPPRWAHFCLNVEKFLLKELSIQLTGTSIVVALSGGADSTALLAVLQLLTPRLSLQIIPAHLDHGIRQESSSEREHAQILCDSLGLLLHIAQRNIPAEAAEKRMGLEEAGREARYAFFEDVRLETRAQWIALGHQLDDLAEDQLLRLVRGAGWPALGGMPAVCQDRHILRPLLLTPRKNLEAFLTDIGISWVTDESNDDPQYRRNRMRHQVLPLLLAENPNYLDSAVRIWRLAQLDQEYWDALSGKNFSAGKISRANHEPYILSGEIIIKLDSPLRLRLYKVILDKFGTGQINQQTLFNLDEAWREGRIGKRFQFPGAKTVEVIRQGLLFRATAPEESSNDSH